MTKRDFIQKFKEASDDAEVYFLPSPQSPDFIQVESASVVRAPDSAGSMPTDDEGNDIPLGSVLLFPY